MLAQLRSHAAHEAKPAAAPAASPHLSTPFTVTQNDPSNDATTPDDPRGDIVSAASGSDRHGIVFKVAMQTPSNPATDINWLGETAIAFLIDTNFDGHFDAYAVVGSFDGELEATLFGFSFGGLCEGTASYDGTNITASFAGCTIGAYRWKVESEYDTSPGSSGDVPELDYAPDSGYSAATPGHRTGYMLEDADGFITTFGNSIDIEPDFPEFLPVGVTSTADGLSVWATDALGGVHTYGLAKYRGGSPHLLGDEQIVAIAGMPGSQGYFLFSSLGRVFAFGTAHSHGDLTGKVLNAPIVGAAITPTGDGYYLVGRDGGVFTFGSARFRGSTGGMRLNSPVLGIAVNSDGSGYWLAAGDGGVFAFHATFRGSMGGKPLNAPVVGISRYGDGYLLAAADGGVFDFSDDPFYATPNGFGGIIEPPFPILNGTTSSSGSSTGGIGVTFFDGAPVIGVTAFDASNT